MYEKLKQIMREAGYEVSKGVEWLATDMQHFVTFSRHVLGATTPHLNHLLAYPEAFPHVMNKAGQLADQAPAATEAVAETPSSDEPVQPAEQAAQEPKEEPKPEQLNTGATLDVSATGQSEKQDLTSAPEQTTEQSSQEQATQAQGTEQATQDQQETPAADQQGAADQSTEGEQPQE